MRIKGQNSCYFGSERDILHALAKLLDEKRSFNIRVNDLTKEANLASATFYFHYHSIAHLVDSNEKIVMRSIDRELNSSDFDNLSLQGKWRNILFCLYKYREFVDIMIKTRNFLFLERILKEVAPKIINERDLFYRNDSIRHAVKFSIIAELDLWQEEKFNVDEIPSHAAHLAYVTTSAPHFFARFLG